MRGDSVHEERGRDSVFGSGQKKKGGGGEGGMKASPCRVGGERRGARQHRLGQEKASLSVEERERTRQQEKKGGREGCGPWN